MSQAGQWTATVMARRDTGDYAVVTLSAGTDTSAARAGQFASVRVAGPDSALLLRRAMWIGEATSSGRDGGTIEVVADRGEPGGAWLAAQPQSARVDVIGPLGRPFSLPRDPTHCLLIGFGAATAALVKLSEELVARGCRVRFLLLGQAAAFGVLAARRFSSEIVDSSGRSIDPREAVLDQLDDSVEVVYSAGLAEQLRPLGQIVTEMGVAHQTAVETPLVCGSRTCTLCALPVRGRDGVTRMVRACTEGPVFRADLVRWDDLGTVPGDCLGAGEEAR
ncbi:MAG: dihydroorotate dehydrogenase electron transfer subunit [Micrococcales bacterium]|nr:dihydroorotate dehydrogenase electron transfer subunit [Micrococcales bacterium]